ncbi:MAG TPA: RNA polymerase sporulation sigma factor SigH [Acidimicrobiales bacterium]|nr:RNA polymerase sporulation sigma factor SigH [Acidimicrobiales bacterium]
MAVLAQYIPLTELSDIDLVARFHEGDHDALATLLERYRRFARAKARGYFLVGADSDDIEQEGMIGLFKAARDFRPDRQASFRAFAELCITRQVITAIKTATRQKHQPLNQYVSISGVRGSDDASERNVEDLLEDHYIADPADTVVSNERMDSMRQSMAEMLSGLEVDVLRLYVEGKSYHEIGEHLGRHVKSIDNALQRIKRKLEGHLAERDASDAEAELAETADDAVLVLI